MNPKEALEKLTGQFDAELAALKAEAEIITRRDKAIIHLLETTTHHMVEHMLPFSPDRTALLDQLREVKESFGIDPCGKGEE